MPNRQDWSKGQEVRVLIIGGTRSSVRASSGGWWAAVMKAMAERLDCHLKGRILPAIVAAAMLAACDGMLGPTRSAFTIRVDSVRVPQSVRATDTITAKVWAFVGNNGCYSFDRFSTTRATDHEDVSAEGVHTVGVGVNCTDALVYMRGEPLTITPPFQSSPFRLLVHQPDGTTLNYAVTIQ